MRIVVETNEQITYKLYTMLDKPEEKQSWKGMWGQALGF